MLLKDFRMATVYLILKKGSQKGWFESSWKSIDSICTYHLAPSNMTLMMLVVSLASQAVLMACPPS